MLVLSRKKNERLVINDNIVITVVEIHGDKVRLGIEAPSSVSVHRQEVYDAIKRQDALANREIKTNAPYYEAKTIAPIVSVDPQD